LHVTEFEPNSTAADRGRKQDLSIDLVSVSWLWATGDIRISTSASDRWKDPWGIVSQVILIPGRIPDDDSCREGVATVLMSCRCNSNLICHCKPPRSSEETSPGGAQPTRLDHPSSGDRSSRAAARDPFGDLPAELLPTILSYLDARQAAQTSVLSSAWRHAWKHSPKLTLDILAICGDGYWSCKTGAGYMFVDRAHDVGRFIDNVNTILRQRRGGAVEQLELRCDEC
jgi:hypothetical protein